MALEPLEVFALTEEKQRATGSIPYKSLMWYRKYYEPGTFLMEVPADVYDASWAYINTDERPEMGIIQKAEYRDTSNGGVDTVILSGFFLEWELNRYTFLVEETEDQAYRIYKPAPVKTVKPTLWQMEGGQTYVKTGGSGGIPARWETLEGDYVDPDKLDTSALTQLDLGAGEGMKLREYDTTNLDKFPSGKWNAGEYSNLNYSYYSKDGKTLHSVAPNGEEKTFKIASGSGTGDVIYEDADGSLKWVNGVASSLEGSYVRAVDSWETRVKSEGLEVVYGDGTIFGGSTYARAYRTVKGPWQYRTDLDVNEPADNVQRIIQWAQDIWGNNLLYDEVGFAGEEKIIDPSLRLFGDLAYEELKTIGASPRLFYSFESDTTVLQIWRGLDRTQSQTKEPFAVFSDTWGTLYGFTASRDVSNYRNTCHVLYQFRDKTDSDGNPIGPRGFVTARLEDELPEAETYLDLRGEEPEEGQTDEAFIESLRQRGLAHLQTNYAVIENLETGTLVQDGYLTGFDLGDKVDMLIEAVGLVKEARITGACEVHEAGSSTVTLEIGEQKITNIRKAVIV